MNGSMRRAAVTLALLMATATAVGAQNKDAVDNGNNKDKSVKIGVMVDLAGLYSDIGGRGSILAAKMAVEDSGMAKKGWKIDLISVDHQNKPDVGINIARQWLDTDKVDAIVDVPTSSVALAVNRVVREKNAILLDSAAGASDLTGSQCTPNTIHWPYDTYMSSFGTATAVTKAGGDTWFFLTADYAFGHAIERDATAVITANGGKVIGSVRHPLNSSDFSSYLLQAQSSRARIIGLANAGSDATNAIKQAAEFGITSGGQKLAGVLMFITDVHALGLQVAQGLDLTESFYWDLNDDTRAFSRRFSEGMTNKSMPTMVHAGVYASIIHYLKILDSQGGNSHDGARIVAAMKAMPSDDPVFGRGSIQPNGRAIHPSYLFEVKKPSESKGPWDYYKLIATIPADQAFTPLSKSPCPLLKQH